MQADPQRVDRRFEQGRGDAVGEDGEGGRVGGHEIPAPVDDDGGKGLVAAEEPVEGIAHRGHLLRVERRGGVHRRVAGGEQQAVALAERHVEAIGEVQHELAARLRTPGLHEAEVAGGHLGFNGEVELAEASPLSPVAQQRSDGRDGHRR